MDVIQTFFADPAGVALKGLLVGAFLVFALGVVAALRDHTFDLKYIDSFIRTTLMGRVVPVALVLLTGYIVHDDLITAAGIAAAGIVAAGMIKSALDSIKQLTLTPTDSATVNPPPVA